MQPRVLFIATTQTDTHTHTYTHVRTLYERRSYIYERTSIQNGIFKNKKNK